ncbi:MAG TPA: hypothetical protein VM325_16685 [Alphaproteobacteria bacterium]|nr:hypothetical protein [Alphaproteobacteria bacterium]
MALIGLAALVAATAVLVYAQDGEKTAAAQAKDKPAVSVPDRLPEPPSKAKSAGGHGPEVLYDATALPEPVQRLLREMILAAQSGDIDKMRLVVELSELKPMVAAEHVPDPVAYWKEQSVDGSGRDVLAAILNLLNSGFVLTGKGYGAMYVWPYFAEADLTKLTPQQEVELYRIVPPERAKAMKETGKYTYYRLGVSPTGVWHYFLE